MPTLSNDAKVSEHPPMLVAFPITFFSSTLLAFVAYAITGDRDWFRLGCAANLAGVVSALIAAVPVILNWAGVPEHSRDKHAGVAHMVLNLVVVTTFAINLGAQVTRLGEAAPATTVPLVLSAVGVALLLVTGYLGGLLAAPHAARGAPAPEREDEAPRITLKDAERGLSADAGAGSIHGVGLVESRSV